MPSNVGSNLIYLFSARTTDGNGTGYPLPFPNNRGKVMVYGTWDSATVTLQSLASDGTTWVAVSLLKDDGTFTPLTFTANTQMTLSGILMNETYRAVMANDGPTTSITLEIEGY